MSADTRRLPVFETVGQSMLYSLRNFGFLIRISSPWILAIAGTGLVYWALMSIFVSPVEEQSTGGTSALTSADGLRLARYDDVLSSSQIIQGAWLGIIVVILVLGPVSIAVRWHRHLFSSETPAWFSLRFGRRELSYLVYGLAICGIGALAMAVVFMMTYVLTPMIDNPAISGSLIVGVLMLILARLHLVLPGRAVGDQWISLRRSFNLTRGNTWRIIAGFILIMLLYLLAEAAAQFAFADVPRTYGIDMMQFYASLAVHLILGSVVLSYLSHCYRFLAVPPGEGDLAE